MTNSAAKPAPSFFQKHATKLVAAFFWLAIIGGYTYYTVSSGLSPLESFKQVLDFMADSPFGPLVFVALYTLRPLILFSAVILTLGAGFLFGPLWGVVLTIIGANLGASLAYLIGRYFGQGVLETSGDETSGFVQRYAERLRNNSFETVLTMRFIFLPYDLVNYLSGFLKVRYTSFILATVLGSLPGTIAFVLFGASTDGDFSGGLPSLDPAVLIASVVIFVGSLGLSRLFKNRESKKTTEQPA